ncbi:MAG TPA: hypothetical protein VD978_29955 [Azospirillum sp.]|nr:hypothetical protein [Azospirillum sp.]
MNERVTADIPSPAYTRGEVAYAASNRDLRVVIHGDPFGMDPQSFGHLVTDSMQNRISGVHTNFTTMPNQTTRPEYSVVLAFNPAQTMLSSYLCSGQPIQTSPPGGPIVVQGAFCRDTGLFGLFGGAGLFGLFGGGALTSATGWLDSPREPTDPDFKALIGNMTQALFPTVQDAATRR